MNAIIFDIDGTLADISHRLHYITGPKKDYTAFYDACTEDTPKESVTWLYDVLCHGQSYIEEINSVTPWFTPIFVTGRPERIRPQTERWLLDHLNNLYTFQLSDEKRLRMRADGDFRPDYIVKAEILKGLREEGYNILLAIEDRQRVVDMWRNNGITCLQVA